MKLKEFLFSEVDIDSVGAEPEPAEQDRPVGCVTLAGKGQGARERRAYVRSPGGIKASAVAGRQPVQEIHGRNHRPHRVRG